MFDFRDSCLYVELKELRKENQKLADRNKELSDRYEKENTELKAKLEKKRIPPRETPIRSRFSGLLCYSMGSLTPSGSLEVSKFPRCYDCFDALNEWEEIEIKVKE